MARKTNSRKNSESGSLAACLNDNAFLAACLGLVAATVLVYWRVGGFDFTNLDDPYYIYDNQMVRAGLTRTGVEWALTTHYFDFWHPLTWMSHMLDCGMFGLKPGLHHLENLAFHIANTLLLFGVLRRMTGALKRSAFVAALFTLHPMHVESVAWLSERKDVLSTLFCLLSVRAYVLYVQSPKSKVQSREMGTQRRPNYYAMALVFFALGLMAKAMVVTLPFVLLLLDYWPLKRGEAGGHGTAAFGDEATKPMANWGRLMREKVPFFALSLASCLITYFSMNAGANVLSGEKIPWGLRLANVPVSYVRYLWKTIWPMDLAPFYPMPDHLAFGPVAGSVLALVLISLAVWRWARRAPYLVVGWLMFLGMLVPVIGIVAMAKAAIADRYTYLASVGLFIAGTWAVAEFTARWKSRALVLSAGAVVILLAGGWLCQRQVETWRNSESLWSHSLEVTGENALAESAWGLALQTSGKREEAMVHYRKALQSDPKDLNANLNLGVALADAGQVTEATNYLARALAIEGNNRKAHIDMANALYRLKDYAGATNHYAQALRVNPNDEGTRRAYALTLIQLGDNAGALAQCGEALKLDPKDWWIYLFQGRALSALGKSDEAFANYNTALTFARSDEIYYSIGMEWIKRDQVGPALANLESALQINPASLAARFQLAALLGSQHRVKEAIGQYRQILRVAPDSPPALNNLAWILATCPQAELRNGAEAVQLAQRACELSGSKETIFLGTLAAAYAEAGDFAKAVEFAQKACDQATASGQKDLHDQNQKMLEEFKKRQPHRESD